MVGQLVINLYRGPSRLARDMAEGMAAAYPSQGAAHAAVVAVVCDVALIGPRLPPQGPHKGSSTAALETALMRTCTTKVLTRLVGNELSREELCGYASSVHGIRSGLAPEDLVILRHDHRRFRHSTP
jgi:hypothetical protein